MFQAMPDSLTQVHLSNLHAIHAVGGTTLAAADRLASLHLNTARTLVEDGAKLTQTLLAARDAEDFSALPAAITHPTLQKAADYGRALYQILTDTQQEFTRVFEEQFATANQTVGATLDKAAKNAPAGSDVALVAIKSAIAAANSAYDNINKAAKQVADLAEANVNAAVEATAKSVAAPAPAPKSRKAAAAA